MEILASGNEIAIPASTDQSTWAQLLLTLLQLMFMFRGSCGLFGEIFHTALRVRARRQNAPANGAVISVALDTTESRQGGETKL